MRLMTVPLAKRLYTVAEYLALEEQSEERHEFHDGEILAMSGGSYRHSKINIHLHSALVPRLENGPCEPLESNMRIRIPPTPKYLYPDTSIVSGVPQFDADDANHTTIINPRVVFEVLSDSTESYDRGAKFGLYREINSLEEYVLVSQRHPQVETFVRQRNGAWLFNAWKGVEESFELRSLRMNIPLAEIYAGVEFDPSLPPGMGVIVPRN